MNKKAGTNLWLNEVQKVLFITAYKRYNRDHPGATQGNFIVLLLQKFQREEA